MYVCMLCLHMCEYGELVLEYVRIRDLYSEFTLEFSPSCHECGEFALGYLRIYHAYAKLRSNTREFIRTKGSLFSLIFQMARFPLFFQAIYIE